MSILSVLIMLCLRISHRSYALNVLLFGKARRQSSSLVGKSMQKFSPKISQSSLVFVNAHLWSKGIVFVCSSSSSSSSNLGEVKESWESETHEGFELTSNELDEFTVDNDENDDNDEFYSSDLCDDNTVVSCTSNHILFGSYTRWVTAVETAISNLERKEKSLTSELEKADKIQSLQSRANLITTYMYKFTPGVKTATVQDWEQDGAPEFELTLNPKYNSASEEASAIYEKARKLKRGSQTIRPLLIATQQDLVTLRYWNKMLSSCVSEYDDSISSDLFQHVQDGIMSSSLNTKFSPPVDESSKSIELHSSNHRSRNTGQQRSSQKKPTLGLPLSNVRKLTSQAGNTIYVGRNRRGNEYLSLTVAKGSDIWMHARGTPGAHVVIKPAGRTSTITDDCIQLAANLAAFYSDARTERKVSVTAAEPKHILKPRGAPLGAVKLREELFVRTGYPEDVPSELKEARDESGLSSEYRATDKAKLRKRNAEATKQRQLKSKSKKKATSSSFGKSAQ